MVEPLPSNVENNVVSIDKAKDERDRRGRFVAGHRGPSKGNPIHIKAIKARLLFQDSVTDKDFINIIKKIVKQALKGCKVSQKLVVEQKIGKLNLEATSEDVREAFMSILAEVQATMPDIEEPSPEPLEPSPEATKDQPIEQAINEAIEQKEPEKV